MSCADHLALNQIVKSHLTVHQPHTYTHTSTYTHAPVQTNASQITNVLFVTYGTTEAKNRETEVTGHCLCEYI